MNEQQGCAPLGTLELTDHTNLYARHRRRNGTYTILVKAAMSTISEHDWELDYVYDGTRTVAG